MNGIRALVFNTFGTLVDWRGGMIDQSDLLNAFHSPSRITPHWGRTSKNWDNLFRRLAMSAVVSSSSSSASVSRLQLDQEPASRAADRVDADKPTIDF
jgi:hypothetical protein